MSEYETDAWKQLNDAAPAAPQVDEANHLAAAHELLMLVQECMEAGINVEIMPRDFGRLFYVRLQLQRPMNPDYWFGNERESIYEAAADAYLEASRRGWLGKKDQPLDDQIVWVEI